MADRECRISNRVKYIQIQIARPAGPDDPGVVEEGWYVVDGHMVTLTDAAGRPLERTGSASSARSFVTTPTRWERRLREGEDALQAVRELLWAKYRASKKGTDFNRPLRLPPYSIA